MVTHIPFKENLQAMFLQSQGMAKHDKRINPGVWNLRETFVIVVTIMQNQQKSLSTSWGQTLNPTKFICV